MHFAMHLYHESHIFHFANELLTHKFDGIYLLFDHDFDAFGSCTLHKVLS